MTKLHILVLMHLLNLGMGFGYTATTEGGNLCDLVY